MISPRPARRVARGCARAQVAWCRTPILLYSGRPAGRDRAATVVARLTGKDDGAMQEGANQARGIARARDPLDLPDLTTNAGDERARRLARLTWAFVGLGVLLRSVRYAM